MKKRNDAARASATRLPAGYGGAALVLAAATLSGCVTVNAPDKPIVIELNINVRQEVVYRLAQDASQLIDENPEIF